MTQVVRYSKRCSYENKTTPAAKGRGLLDFDGGIAQKGYIS